MILKVEYLLLFIKLLFKKLDSHHNLNIEKSEVNQSFKELSKQLNFDKKIKISKLFKNLYLIDS